MAPFHYPSDFVCDSSSEFCRTIATVMYIVVYVGYHLVVCPPAILFDPTSILYSDIHTNIHKIVQQICIKISRKNLYKSITIKYLCFVSVLVLVLVLVLVFAAVVVSVDFWGLSIESLVFVASVSASLAYDTLCGCVWTKELHYSFQRSILKVLSCRVCVGLMYLTVCVCLDVCLMV